MAQNDTQCKVSGRLKVQQVLSAVMVALGAALMTMMIIVESELGALPLLLLVAGGIWLFITRARIRSQNRQTS